MIPCWLLCMDAVAVSRVRRKAMRCPMRFLSAAVLIFSSLMLACTQPAAAPTAAESENTTAPASPTDTAMAKSTDTQPSVPTQVANQPPDPSSNPDAINCVGAEAVRNIRAEYEANHIRAKDTYIGERMCLRGEISGFSEDERASRIGVKVGDDAGFSLAHINRDNRSGPAETAEVELNSWRVWRVWMLESSVGDSVEAVCRIETFTPTKQDPKRAVGIPLFTDCQRVVDGVLWTPPAATPVPTPTSLPCASAEFGDRSRWWLNIDCPAKKVTVSRTWHRDESGGFDFLSDGDSAVVTIEYDSDSVESARRIDEHPSTWMRWVEGDQTGESVREMWEAPGDIAEEIISYWRRGEIYGISIAVGECCRPDRDERFHFPNP